MSSLSFKTRMNPVTWVSYRLHAIDFSDPLTLPNIVGSWNCATVAEDKP